ncbi:MAG: RelA/SpoT domain-containing protein [Candidatus Sulfotelmatobacter sp.]
MTSLKENYTLKREKVLVPLAARIEDHLKNLFGSLARIDRISARAKSVDRFLGKAAKLEDGKPKYKDPLNQIQDQVGARIVTFYASDVERVRLEIEKYFKYIESQRIVPESEKEFGYEGRHFILFVPEDLVDDTVSRDESVELFELQIKTLFQHAWSEAEHDLGYKPSVNLTRDQNRRLAFTAAQAWGADQIFDEMFRQMT